MLRPVNRRIVGTQQHHSGWPYVVEALSPLFSPTGILFDDFIEQAFLYTRSPHVPYTEPWIGVLHHPPDMPADYLPAIHLTELDKQPAWQQSLPHLRLLLTLGNPLREWCQSRWDVPVVALRHPIAPPAKWWSPAAFQHQPLLLQVGWFLRNIAAIHQVVTPSWLPKAILRPTIPAGLSLAQLERRNRRQVGTTIVLPRQDHEAYEALLSRSVVFMEVFSAVANNTVVECIARNVPLCVNRHPGVEDYLGESYPLFYTVFEDVPRLLTLPRILEAHRYLKTLDKWWLNTEFFREHLRTTCEARICRTLTTI